MNNLKYNKNKIKVVHIGNKLNKKNSNIYNSQKKNNRIILYKK